MKHRALHAVLSTVLGLAALINVGFGLQKDALFCWDDESAFTVYEKEEPIIYWMFMGLQTLVGAGCLFLACMIILKADNFTAEAGQVIQREVDNLRSKSYGDLRTMIATGPITGKRVGRRGEEYQFEIQACWDDEPDRNIRLIGSIDEIPHKHILWKIPVVRWVSMYSPPVTHNVIKSPSDEFVGG